MFATLDALIPARNLRAATLFFLAGMLCLTLMAETAQAQRGKNKDDGGEVTEYGSLKNEGGTLIGILYDLKQTQQGERTGLKQREYDYTVNEFLSSDWDEAVLNKFFRVTRPLYTTQVFVPRSDAGRAPRAFQVEDVVAPKFWMIHYKGQVTPPSSGRWRFWGYGSEVCSVAVNGKTVLSSNWIEGGKLRPIATPDLDWVSSAPPGRKVHRGLLTAGTWMDLKAGEIIDLDILIGERAGGNFSAVLLIEKEGMNYEERDGHKVYHVFQLKPFDTPTPPENRSAPPFARNGPIWKAVP